MKKLILGMVLGMVMFVSTSMSAWAGRLDTEISEYFTARYYSGVSYIEIDFEQVKGVFMVEETTRPKILVTFKDGSNIDIGPYALSI